MIPNIELLQRMEKAALLAGAHLLAARKLSKSPEAFVKSDNSLVLNLDLECQDKIRQTLLGEIAILSEEDESSHDLMKAEGDYFVVDPIDGTASCKRFLKQDGGQIGFGPLIGLVQRGHLVGASYYNVPTRILYSALKDQGAYAQLISDASHKSLRPLMERRRLCIEKERTLRESGLLFFPGSEAELKLVLYLRDNNLIENTYRLGGFANDSCRIAEDFEQVQLQCRVKAWDFSAAIIPAEAGFSVTVDPFGAKKSLNDWKVTKINSTLVVHPNCKEELFEYIQKAAR